jgi:hypothetical protein
MPDMLLPLGRRGFVAIVTANAQTSPEAEAETEDP